MRILVVNDERTAANSIAEILHRNGHNVLPLYDAVEAVEHAEHVAFDVAILGSLGTTEVALGRALRESMQHCKVIRCVGRCIAELMRALDAEFGYLAMDLKRRRRTVHQAPLPMSLSSTQPTHTFNVEELLEQLDEIRVQKAVDAHFGSQWNISPMFVRRAKSV